jgi:hypothetical protein
LMEYRRGRIGKRTTDQGWMKGDTSGSNPTLGTHAQSSATGASVSHRGY